MRSNWADAISVTDLEVVEFVPMYYCETCGRELSYPATTGLCPACEHAREEPEVHVDDPRR